MPPPSRRADLLTCLGLFFLALALRLLFLHGSPDKAWPHSALYEGDAPTWIEYARALDAGQSFESNLPLRSPAVAYLLHWLPDQWLAGPFTALKVICCIISAATCPLAFLCFSALFSRRASLIAAMLSCFSFGSYITATSLNNECLYTFALLVSIFLTQRFRKLTNDAVGTAGGERLAQQMLPLAILLGFTHALCALIRPEHPLLLVLLLAWMLLPLPRRTSIIALPAILIPFALTCLPWQIRAWNAVAAFDRDALQGLPDFNAAQPPWSADARAALEALPPFARLPNFQYLNALAAQQGDDLITAPDVAAFFDTTYGYTPRPLSYRFFISSQGPLAFALANNPASNGLFSKAPLASPILGPDPVLNFAFPPHNELVNDGFSVGLRTIRDDPSAWFGLVATKLHHLLDGASLGFTAYNLPHGRSGIRNPVDIITPLPGAGSPAGLVTVIWKCLVVALLIAGAVIAIRTPGGSLWPLIVLYKVIVTILFFGYARQAAAIAPAFFILLSLPNDAALTRFVAGKPARERMLPMLGMAALTILMAIDLFAAMNPSLYTASGRITPAPQWGPEAFTSYEPVTIAPAAAKP